ncbi:MAG: hypothetical protein HC898_11790 [Phycisphaerales bacterium]|nr:hypothetical protein [Phycisphaerales bacterium]
MNPSGRWSVYSMAVACLLALAVWVVPTHAQEAPFTGVIVEDNTLVRSGGGNPFYAVARLPKGATVTVEEVVFGWYRIAPPPGSASVIEKARCNWLLMERRPR